MTRPWTSLAVGVVMVAAACTAPQSVANTTPNVSASPQASPTPSPSPDPLTISGAPFHAGEIGFGYAPVSPIAKGGVPPYTWEITGGALPSGLAMALSGKVTGTPTILGTYLFSIHVTDSAGTSSTLQSSITITRRLVVTGNPCTPVSPCSVEAGCVTVCGVFGFQTGGIAPYKYKVVSGGLPTGMGLSGFTLTKGFPGPPSQAGKDWVFTVRVTDAIGASAETTAKFHVFPHIAFTGPLSADCKGTSSCSITPQLTYVLGTPGLAQPTVKVGVISGPSWPSALAFIAPGGVVSRITCNGSPPPGFNGKVSIVLQDKSTCAANQYCVSRAATLTVNLTCP